MELRRISWKIRHMALKRRFHFQNRSSGWQTHPSRSPTDGRNRKYPSLARPRGRLDNTCQPARPGTKCWASCQNLGELLTAVEGKINFLPRLPQRFRLIYRQPNVSLRINLPSSHRVHYRGIRLFHCRQNVKWLNMHIFPEQV